MSMIRIEAGTPSGPDIVILREKLSVPWSTPEAGVIVGMKTP